MTVEQTTPVAPSRRLRFSLRGLIVCVGAICLLVSNSVALRELHRLRAENQRMRDELGYLTITDPAKPHVAAAPQLEELRWRWRIYVPDGRQFAVFVDPYASGAELTRPEVNRVPATSGENRLDIAVYRGPTGKWQLKAASKNIGSGNGVTFRVELPNETGDRLQRSRVDGSPSSGTVAFETDGQLVLLQEIAPEITLFGGTADNRRGSFRVWLEESTSADRAANSTTN